MDERPGRACVSGQDNDLSEKEREKIETRARNARLVAEYLRRHPEFFLQHEGLATKLEVPHPIEGAVSLIEYQNRLLREQNTSLRRRIRTMLQVARENETLGQHMHALSLKLVQARSPREAFDTLIQALSMDFRSDFTAITIFAQQAARAGVPCEEFIGSAHPQRRLFETWLARTKPVTGRLSAEQAEALFHDRADNVGSAVVMPLKGKDWDGLVAAGSREAGRFYADMGIEMLAQIAQLASLMTDRWIAREATV